MLTLCMSKQSPRAADGPFIGLVHDFAIKNFPISESQLKSLKDAHVPITLPFHPKSMFANMCLSRKMKDSKLYQATRIHDKRNVAIKKLPINSGLDCKNEAVMALLCGRTPHIVPVHATFRTKRNIWIVMDWLEGGSLTELLLAQPLSPEIAAHVIKQIMEPIEWMHARQRAHRDIQAKNLLLDRYGQVHISDFGWAVQYSRNNRLSGEFVGASLFMAREHLSNNDEYSAVSADVWSLGLLAYELIKGHEPKLTNSFKIGVPKIEDRIDCAAVNDFIRMCLDSGVRRDWSIGDLRDHQFISAACLDDEWFQFLMERGFRVEKPAADSDADVLMPMDDDE